MFLSYYYQPNDLKRDFSLKESTENTSQNLIPFEANVEILLSYRKAWFSPRCFCSSLNHVAALLKAVKLLLQRSCHPLGCLVCLNYVFWGCIWWRDCNWRVFRLTACQEKLTSLRIFHCSLLLWLRTLFVSGQQLRKLFFLITGSNYPCFHPRLC